ncbi:MAG TPA: glycosyltransferase, partial [Candidatus Polarisedimenticolia bacterium]|nr:glycosyltransferase [Candidatus Polarisedimenticolia bacterium]
KTIVFFPEAAFGPALNCVGIAQACRDLGHRAVFVADRSFGGVFAKYGFEERLVDMSEPMDAAKASQFWKDFIAAHLPHFRLSPIEQLSTYVVPVWEAVVDSAVYVEPGLSRALAEIGPDLICVDNIILFPAVKRAGCPWIRIISCSENEITDPDIPPHLSGCGENDRACHRAFQAEFDRLIRPCHERYNRFLASVDHPPYPLGEFFETSPHLNLLLYPKPLAFRRRVPLDPVRFQYLEGCVRDEGSYEVPRFERNNDTPLLYVSYGSLGAADIDLYRRQINLLGRLPYRVLMNVGDYVESYADLPGNVQISSFFPQPALLPHCDLVVHHGGNNTFNEALYFGKPSLIMPFCWDGLDNATRIQETGYGACLPRYDWTDERLATTIERLLHDRGMHERLRRVSAHMRSADGRRKAGGLIDALLAGRPKERL